MVRQHQSNWLTACPPHAHTHTLKHTHAHTHSEALQSADPLRRLTLHTPCADTHTQYLSHTYNTLTGPHAPIHNICLTHTHTSRSQSHQADMFLIKSETTGLKAIKQTYGLQCPSLHCKIPTKSSGQIRQQNIPNKGKIPQPPVYCKKKKLRREFLFLWIRDLTQTASFLSLHNNWTKLNNYNMQCPANL